MRKALACSLVLHLAVVVLAYLGIPTAQKDFAAGSDSVAVELVAVADTTNLPPPRPAAEPAKAAPATRVDPKPQVQSPPKSASKPQPPAPPKPETAKPETTKTENAKTEAPPKEVKPPVPAPAPAVKPQQAAKAEAQPPKPAPPQPAAPQPAPPQPASVPAPQAAAGNLKPAPPPKPVQRQKPDQPAPAKAAKDQPASAPAEAKPAPAADFQSVLKTVETLAPSARRTPAKQEPAAKTAPDKASSPQADAKKAAPAPADKAMDALIGQALGSGTATASAAASTSGRYDPGQPMSVSEIDAVRRQIEKCWNVPAGARDAGDHVVTIRVEMSPDATPRSAIVVNETSTHGNAFHRAAAESALRAVLNPRCHPFRLPLEKYERWKTMTLVFNPKDMLGT